MQLVRNGEFTLWPTATSFSIATGTADTDLFPSWTFNKLHANQPAVVVSQQTFDSGAAIEEGRPHYYLRINPTGAGTATADATYARLTYTFPNPESLTNTQVVVSFWAKASIAREIVVDFHRYLGEEGEIVVDGADEVVHGRQSFQLTADWKRFEFSVRIPDIALYSAIDTATSALQLRFYFQGGADYLGTSQLLWRDSTVDISQVSVTTPVKRNYESFFEYPINVEKDSTFVANPTFTTLTDGVSVTQTCSVNYGSQNASVTLGGNRTLVLNGKVNGMRGVLIVKQPSSGGPRTLTLPAGSIVTNNGSGAVDLTDTANAVDVLRWVYDGTNIIWTADLNAT